MSRQVRRSLALALAGLLGGLGLVLALFGGDSLRRLTGRAGPETSASSAPGGSPRGLADPGALAGRVDPPIDFRDDKPGRARPAPGPGPAAALPQDPRAGAAGAPQAGPGRDARLPEAAEAPRFDIVRVEPNGDAVVAGRGAPDAAIEMLVDGKPVARAKADANGQFAIVPPALPAGASTLRLRMTGADGRATESQQSVAVDVAPGRDRQPLVALTAPDAATVVLSQPGAPGTTADAQGGAQGGAKGGAKGGGSGTRPGAEPGTRAADAAPAGGGETRAAAASGSAPTRIASVDVQGSGRLFVTATGTPGARIQLYLNDTLIAPGSIGPDGRATFTIGRGIKPGQYQVRIDQVDPATGKVASRAAVPLAVPEPTQVAARETAEPAPAPAQEGARDHGGRDRAALAGSGRDGSGQDRPAAASPPAAVSNPQLADMAGPDRVGAVFVPEISTARITRGDNLWRISQRTYGRGERYTVIYDANQNQIRDPDLIYPGQIFVLPTDKRG